MKRGPNIWLQLLLLIALHVTTLDGKPSPAITVTCMSCKIKGPDLTGVIGGDLQVQYTINSTQFNLLNIFYNTTNEIVVAPHLVNTKGVKDQRFQIPTKLDEDGANRVKLSFVLKGLSEYDHGASFVYKYRDSKLMRFSDINIVTVTAASTLVGVSNDSNSNGVVIGVILAILVIIIIVLVYLVYKGTISSACCQGIFCPKTKTNDLVPFYVEDRGDKVYAAPSNQYMYQGKAIETEYADLGPGGGRLDKPVYKPSKSTYAQVKTDVDYPTPDFRDFEEPDSIIV